MKRLFIGLPFVFISASALLAQDVSPTPEISGAAAAGILGGVCIFYLILIAIWLFVAIWIMKDSKKRNSPNRTLVVVLGIVPAEEIAAPFARHATRSAARRFRCLTKCRRTEPRIGTWSACPAPTRRCLRVSRRLSRRASARTYVGAKPQP